MCLSYKTFIVVVSCLTNLILAQDNPCTTPNNEPGDCIPFNKCVALFNEWKSYGTNKPDNLRKYILQSRCTTNQIGSRICCASAPVTTKSATLTTLTTQNPMNSDYTSKLNKRGFDILNSLTTCGNINGDRIAFGKDANLNDFPWMVLLQYDSIEKPFQCGGTLITNRYVLTAAHCVRNVDIIGVRLGEFDIASVKDCQVYGRKTHCNPAVEDVGIDQIKLHPQYSAVLYRNDIALIKMNRNVEFNVHIKPICLPITEHSAALETDKKLLIAGWGTTEEGFSSNKLQFTEVSLKEGQLCKNVLRRSIGENQLCALGENGQDTCRGDSGGPLFNETYDKTSRQFVQYGVVSYGYIGCGSGNITYPGVYANIVNLLPWITENID